LILPLLPVGETHLTVLLHHHPSSSHPPSQRATPSGSILSIILPSLISFIHSSTPGRTHARTRAVVFPPLGYPLLPTSQIGLGRLFWSFAWLVVVYLNKQQRTTTTVRYHPVTLTFTLITTIHSLGWLLLSLCHQTKLLLPGLLACLPASSSLDLGTYPPRLNLGIVLLQPPPLSSSILSHPLLGLALVWSGLVCSGWSGPSACWPCTSTSCLACFWFLVLSTPPKAHYYLPTYRCPPTLLLPLLLPLPLPLPSNLTSTTGRPPARRCLPLPPPVPPVTT
jgi:hypothetical protein